MKKWIRSSRNHKRLNAISMKTQMHSLQKLSSQYFWWYPVDMEIVMARVIYTQLHHQSNLIRAFLKRCLNACVYSQKYASIFLGLNYFGKVILSTLWLIFLMMLTKACFKSFCACETWRLPQKLFRVHGVLWTIWQELWIWKAETRWPRSYYSRPPISVRTKFQRNFILPFLHLSYKMHTLDPQTLSCYKLCVTCNILPIEMVTTKLCKNCKCCPWSRFILRRQLWSESIKVTFTNP